jgi:calcineurin-like phosphoesterase family protein
MNTFLIADTHFGHQGVCEFTDLNGNPLRPWDSWEEMDEVLVDNWNKVVRPKDKVYHLGDVAMKKIHLKTLLRLNGDKVLVKGNHDIFNAKEYAPYFYDVRGTHKLDRFLLSHIPIHPESMGRCSHNIHGHIHERQVMRVEQITVGKGTRYSHLEHVAVPDPRYICVSVEQTNYTPISLEEIKAKHTYEDTRPS